MEAEKELGVSGRRAITDYGIDRFNDYCRTSVLRYTQEWESYVTRQARWVDFENDYKTMDLAYMESRHVGVQAAVGQGPRLRGLPGHALLVGCARRRCPTSRSASTTPPAPARTRPLTVAVRA